MDSRFVKTSEFSRLLFRTNAPLLRHSPMPRKRAHCAPIRDPLQFCTYWAIDALGADRRVLREYCIINLCLSDTRPPMRTNIEVDDKLMAEAQKLSREFAPV